jgi:hypothetical protein
MDTALKVFVENVSDITSLFSLRTCNKATKELCDDRFKNVYPSYGERVSLYDRVVRGPYDPLCALAFVDHYGLVRTAAYKLIKKWLAIAIPSTTGLSFYTGDQAMSPILHEIGRELGKHAVATTVRAVIQSSNDIFGPDGFTCVVAEFYHGMCREIVQRNPRDGAVLEVIRSPGVMRSYALFYAFNRDNVTSPERFKCILLLIFDNASVEWPEWVDVFRWHETPYDAIKSRPQFFCDLLKAREWKVFNPMNTAIENDDLDMFKRFEEIKGKKSLSGMLSLFTNMALERGMEKWPKCHAYIKENYPQVFTK